LVGHAATRVTLTKEPAVLAASESQELEGQQPQEELEKLAWMAWMERLERLERLEELQAVTVSGSGVDSVSAEVVALLAKMRANSELKMSTLKAITRFPR
jgi:hypothetical protein